MGAFSSAAAEKLFRGDENTNGTNYRAALQERFLEAAKGLKLGQRFTFTIFTVKNV